MKLRAAVVTLKMVSAAAKFLFLNVPPTEPDNSDLTLGFFSFHPDCFQLSLSVSLSDGGWIQLYKNVERGGVPFQTCVSCVLTGWSTVSYTASQDISWLRLELLSLFFLMYILIVLSKWLSENTRNLLLFNAIFEGFRLFVGQNKVLLPDILEWKQNVSGHKLLKG